MKPKNLFQSIILILAFFFLNQTSNAQCGKNKVAMYICQNNKCHNACVLSEEASEYKAIGYSFGHCTKSTFCGGAFYAQNENTFRSKPGNVTDLSIIGGGCFCSIPGYGCRDYDLKCREKCTKICQHHSNIIDENGVITNTFSTVVNVSFVMESTENVSLKIYDINGRLIKEIVNKSLETGAHILSWDIKNEGIALGTYLIKLETASITEIQKIVVTN